MHHSVCVATCLPVRAALRIHISAEVKHALDAVGGFRTEHRGLVDVKVNKLHHYYYCEQAFLSKLLFPILHTSSGI